MRERDGIISNLAALAVAAVLLTGVIRTIPEPSKPVPLQNGVEVSLEAAEEPKPEEKPQAGKEPAAASLETPQPVEPTPPAETPPPPPPPPPAEPAPEAKPEETAKTEEAPKPPEPLLDPEGELAKGAEERQPATQKEVSAFTACLQGKVRYPSSKITGKRKPHGIVVVTVTISKGAIKEVGIAKSSGSPVLDEAAASSVLASGCGLLVGAGTLSGKFAY
jgi:outer membrane biosynthesis protein TonB